MCGTGLAASRQVTAKKEEDRPRIQPPIREGNQGRGIVRQSPVQVFLGARRSVGDPSSTRSRSKLANSLTPPLWPLSRMLRRPGSGSCRRLSNSVSASGASVWGFRRTKCRGRPESSRRASAKRPATPQAPIHSHTPADPLASALSHPRRSDHVGHANQQQNWTKTPFLLWLESIGSAKLPRSARSLSREACRSTPTSPK